ncbi:MAG: hypothetical protein IJW43_03975 [Clostridia bacterium]|nr:hypothetical protein [Clostridia bacterium]
MKSCKICNENINAYLLLCPTCGATICPRCIETTHNYCPYCLTEIDYSK